VKPAPFDYLAPTNLEGVLDALASDREVKVLAGGQSLIPVMNLRMGHPEVLVDVSRIEALRGIAVDADGALHVGAGVRQATVLDDVRVRERWPLLTAALSFIGHPQIRSRGTVCGSIAHADSAAELPAAALALGATIVAVSRRGERHICADDFFLAPFTTALDDDELVTEVIFPAAPSGWAFDEFATRRGDFATAGVGVAIDGDADGVRSCRIALFGVAGTAVRCPDAEAALVGTAVDEAAVAAAVATGTAGLHPPDDIHATGAYRVEIAGRLLSTAIATAWERCHD